MHFTILIALFLVLCQMADAQHLRRDDLESIIRSGPIISTKLRPIPTDPPQSASANYDFNVLDVPGSTQTHPQGINQSGEIVGTYFTGEFTHGFLLTAEGLRTVDFTGPGAGNSALSGINTAGQILAGWVDDAHHSVLLNSALEIISSEIQYPNTFGTGAFGLNDSPQIVGRYLETINDIDSGILHAFLLSGDSYSTIDFPGAYWSEATGINNLGKIVGNYGYLPQHWDSNGFLLTGSGRKQRFTAIDFPGAIGTRVSGINDAGDIVGYYIHEDATVHGFLFSKGVFYTLDYPGAWYSAVSAINKFGQIVGQFSDATGIHGFYAAPKITIRNKVKD